MLLKKLNTFLKENWGAPVVYIQGPQVIGKSHLLLHCATLLCSEPDTRVLFIGGMLIHWPLPYYTLIANKIRLWCLGSAISAGADKSVEVVC